MAKIKITSNPYNREINYFSFNEATGEWVPNDDVNQDGYLRSIGNKRCFLPFKIKEIINLIVAEYGSSDEIIEIVFQGTNEEFDEVKKVCSSPEYADKASLSQDDANSSKLYSLSLRKLYAMILVFVRISIRFLMRWMTSSPSVFLVTIAPANLPSLTP